MQEYVEENSLDATGPNNTELLISSNSPAMKKRSMTGVLPKKRRADISKAEEDLSKRATPNTIANIKNSNEQKKRKHKKSEKQTDRPY
jgi:hypothetical protein